MIRSEHAIDLREDDEGMINVSIINRPAKLVANPLRDPSHVYGSAVILVGNADTTHTAALTPEREARMCDLLGIPAAFEADPR
ncbi:hypothetical protein [Rathayibacter sp. VKM Ac-2857]|uniref:hypothetical protein n=1 Tax=Rathayibacter sp. VKM Ac-2857 TaxID=2739020 RepID=UPI0015635D2B|nr:hypothetical protein [Rathayibacter sp. VKM Ac-2857]NQX17237.1 hypothetical protein [Rathayibacter sp. VKM Ac-2857]